MIVGPLYRVDISLAQKLSCWIEQIQSILVKTDPSRAFLSSTLSLHEALVKAVLSEILKSNNPGLERTADLNGCSSYKECDGNIKSRIVKS